MRLPPTPCRVCFRPCVFNKFSHFWQKPFVSKIFLYKHLPARRSRRARRRSGVGHLWRALFGEETALYLRAVSHPCKYLSCYLGGGHPASRWPSSGGSASCGLAPCWRVSTIQTSSSLSVRTPAPCTRTCSRATRPPLRRPLRVTLTPLLRRARTSRCRSVSSRSTPLTPLTAR